MTKGIVYILTNPCLEGWVKIGQTCNTIEERLLALNNQPNIPLSFRAHAVYKVENPEEIERHIHSLFDIIDESLHARETLSSGRIREREFFRISPEDAFDVFTVVSLLRGDNDCLERIDPNEEQIEDERIAEQKPRRKKFKFSMLNIPIGSELKFLYDEECFCRTKDMGNKIEYEGDETTLSALAERLLIEKRGRKAGSAHGTAYFTYNGSTLYDLRKIKESGGAD